MDTLHRLYARHPWRYTVTLNRCNIHVWQIRHLSSRFNPQEQYGDEDFRLCFRLRNNSVSDFIKILDRDLQKRMQKSYWRFIWCIHICSMHSHSKGFKGYCETKRIIQPAIPRERGWYQEKVLWCWTLFFTSLFTFDDVVHFSRLCKLWSFLDWSFSRLQLPWSWLRSRVIL